ncbi:MAG: hypothetical protein KDA36_07835 [Planctomycetaceae bacterium]|nr:hypothetical protein [Planctomycetaceae bacterium]
MSTIPAQPAEEAKPNPQPPVRKRRSWIKSLILAFIVFLAGSVAGGAGTLLFVHRHLADFIRNPHEAPQKIIPILKRRLGLDPEQTAKIETIIREHHRNLQEIRYETTPRVRTEIDAIQTEVADVLNPDQRELWNRRMTQLTDFWFPTLPPPPHQTPPPPHP